MFFLPQEEEGREGKDRAMMKSSEDSSGEPDLLLPEEWMRMTTAYSEMVHLCPEQQP